MNVRIEGFDNNCLLKNESRTIDLIAIDFGVKGLKKSAYELYDIDDACRTKNEGIAFQAYDCLEFDADLFPHIFGPALPDEMSDIFDAEVESFENYETQKINNALELTDNIRNAVLQLLKEDTNWNLMYLENYAVFSSPKVKVSLNDQDFSDVLAELLDLRNMSQKDLAELCGFSKSAVGRMINPQSEQNLPNTSGMIKIAFALKLSKEEFQRLSRKNPRAHLVDYKLGDIIFKELLETEHFRVGNGTRPKAEMKANIKNYIVYTLRAAASIKMNNDMAQKQLPFKIDDYLTDDDMAYIKEKPKCEVSRLETETSDNGRLFTFDGDYKLITKNAYN